jgi:multiple sugar transport system permease protein/putative aldouronate transport system permease protein
MYLLLVIPVVYVFIFNYMPMYGILMAFKRFNIRAGVWGSPWAGMYQFNRLFNSPNFWPIIRNTLILSVYGLVAAWPFPIILALFINHCFLNKYKRTVQTMTFAPHLLSSVIMVGLIIQILSLRTGAVNVFLSSIGQEQINFMSIPGLFPHIYVWSGIWQGTGYSAIIYIATLAGVDPNMHEAAIIDGANLWQRMWHIDLATIRPMIVIMLILSVGGILSTSFEKVYLLQNSLNLNVSEVLTTYVYKVGLGAGGEGGAQRADYSFGTAIGLFQNVVGILLTLMVNKIANAVSGDGLF